VEKNIDIFDNNFERNIEEIDDVILKDTNTASCEQIISKHHQAQDKGITYY